MPSIPVDYCCGCTACYNSCPVSAITMVADPEGFRYPMVDTTVCCGCGKCEQVCPMLHIPVLPEQYAGCVIAQHKEPAVLEESTSGGFVDALCSYVLREENGYVAGVAYDDAFLPVHKIAHSYKEATVFRNSKYAQSEMGDVFKQVYSLLRDGACVMFVGTPCQVAGLTNFLGKDYDNLIRVDLVCRSIPSPKLWRAYLNWQEARYGAKIKKIVCRKKTYGYHSGTLQIEFENGKRYSGSNRVDYYMKSFHSDICSRPSCYQCPFKTRHHCSDFTVFDSWRPHMATDPAIKDNDRGYSNVLVHTQKGEQVLAVLNSIHMYPVEPEKLLSVMGSMIEKRITYPAARADFYRELDEKGFAYTVKHYSKVSLADKLIEAAKPIRYSLKKLQQHR